MVLSVITLILVMFYAKFCITKKQESTKSNFNINKFIVIINIIGLISFALPWINVPIIGGVSPIKMLSNTNFSTEMAERILTMVIPLTILFLGMIVGSILQMKLNSRTKQTKIFEIISALIFTVLGILIMADINNSWNTSTNGVFSEMLSITYSIGFGLYLLIFIGIIQIIGLFALKE